MFPVMLVLIAAAPSATLQGNSLEFEYAGQRHRLEGMLQFFGGEDMLHFDEKEGSSQLWLFTKGLKTGKPARVYDLIVTLSKDSSRRDVSKSCRARGTVTLKASEGGDAAGEIDVVVTCKKVPELAQPITIRGRFEKLRVIDVSS